MSGLEKLLLITISFEERGKTSVVELLNLSLRHLARADFKSLHQQRAHGNETKAPYVLAGTAHAPHV